MSLEGRLEDLGLPDIFQIIGLSKRSGVLTIIRKDGSGRLVFHEGQVVNASSDNLVRIGYSLVKKNLISTEDLENALRIQKSKSIKKPIGTILMENGVINREDLENEIRNHILLVVKDLLSWEKGSFHFELGKVITEDIVFNTGMNTDFLLLEGARLQDEEKERGPVSQEITPEPFPIREKKEAMGLGPSTPQSPPSGAGVSPRLGGSFNAEQTLPPEKPIQPPATAQGLRSQNSQAGAVVNDSVEGKKNRKDLNLLTSMIEELSGPSTSSEITLLILRYASELMNRAVVFLVRKDDIMGLGQFGVVLKEGSPNEKVRNIQIPIDSQSVLSGVIKNKMTYKGGIDGNQWNSYLLEQLGGGKPAEVFAAPLISDGKVIALLYGDNLPNQEQIMETEGLEAFIRVAGFAFGKALLERRLMDSKS